MIPTQLAYSLEKIAEDRAEATYAAKFRRALPIILGAGAGAGLGWGAGKLVSHFVTEPIAERIPLTALALTSAALGAYAGRLKGRQQVIEREELERAAARTPH